MPTYDYKCQKCGEVKEITRRYEDRDNPMTHYEGEFVYESCGGEMRRIPTMPGLAGFGKHGRSL